MEMNRNSQSAVYDGILLVDKEQDWTSFDVVNKLRNVLHVKKMGHAGTLDPMATGLLVILSGKATKLSDSVMGHDKEYYATMTLGVSTDTQDIWGNVIGGSPEAAASMTDEQILNAVRSYTGEIDQIPPMYSAIKIKGKKLYELARKGTEVERKPRHIVIHELEMLGRDGNDVRLRIECSSGTYIRTLCHDIGEFLGCGACMSELRRTKIGGYSIENAHRISEIKDGEYLIEI